MLEGFDLLIIVAFLAIIFFWGPGKLPEMARSIGQAKREFDKASSEVASLSDPSSILKPQTSRPTTTPASTEPREDPLVTAAKSLGIDPDGKTKKELAVEIVNRTTKSDRKADDNLDPTGNASD